MSVTRFLGFKFKDLNYVFCSVFIDLIICAILILISGEHVKFKIVKKINKELLFFILFFIIYLFNFTRFYLLYRNRSVYGPLDKICVVLRIPLFLAASTFIYQILNPNSPNITKLAKLIKSMVIFMVWLIILCIYSTKIYWDIIWGTQTNKQRLIREFKAVEKQQQQTTIINPQNYPETYGNYMIREYEKIREGNSIFKNYENKHKLREQQTQENNWYQSIEQINTQSNNHK